jgi:hypothetical protein
MSKPNEVVGVASVLFDGGAAGGGLVVPLQQPEIAISPRIETR